jgi:hypothetical protein
MQSSAVGEKPSTAQERRPVSHRLVWTGLVALALVILAVFGVGYWVLVKYEPRAARHIPKQAVAAVRVDVEQVVLYEPIRRHVFPVLDGANQGASRLKRFKELSGVNLGMDLREIVAAWLPDGNTVVLIGGLFPQQGLPEALFQTLSTTIPANPCTFAVERMTCPGWSLTQASDGIVVIATNDDALTAATSTSDWSTSVGLPATPIAASLNAGGQYSGLTGWALTSVVGPWLNELERLTVSTDLGDPLKVSVVLEGVGVNRTEELRNAVALGQRLAGLRPGPDMAGERGVLARLEVVEANGRPVLESSWPRADVDKAVRALADVVSRVMAPLVQTAK